jgi:hypothetical protein
MTIPEAQLTTWANPGATASAESTHHAIREALNAQAHLIGRSGWEIYLQGSYRNATNIRGDSDVDIVVELPSVFAHNSNELPPWQKSAFDLSYANTDYTWWNFRADVLRALRGYFGEHAVRDEINAIKMVDCTPLKADVVPAIQYNGYSSFISMGNEQHVEGIAFWRQDNQERVVNFPKLHYQNGAAKNAVVRTAGNYKPLVRMFKNARLVAMDRRHLAPKSVPSYFLECLLSNVPDQYFTGGKQEGFVGIVTWLSNANLDGFRSQNGVIPLFGTSRQQWNTTAAYGFLLAMRVLWEKWA